MRYVLFATAFVTLSLNTGACGPDRQDATVAACATAVSMSKARTADYESDVHDLFVVAATNGSAAGERAMAAFRAKLTAWSEKLTAFTQQPIEADVKAALTEAASYVMKLADPNDGTSVDTAVQHLTNATEKLETACA